jgi:hypothetical protein
MTDFTITVTPGYATIDHGIRTSLGVTREQAKDAQEVLFNSGDVPVTITLAPGTGIFVRPRQEE